VQSETAEYEDTVADALTLDPPSVGRQRVRDHGIVWFHHGPQVHMVHFKEDGSMRELHSSAGYQWAEMTPLVPG